MLDIILMWWQIITIVFIVGIQQARDKSPKIEGPTSLAFSSQELFKKIVIVKSFIHIVMYENDNLCTICLPVLNKNPRSYHFVAVARGFPQLTTHPMEATLNCYSEQAMQTQ